MRVLCRHAVIVYDIQASDPDVLCIVLEPHRDH